MIIKSTLPPVEGSTGKSHPLAEGLKENYQSHTNSKVKLGKLSRMLLIFACGHKLNTFKAQNLGDTCLNTTVSDLQIRHALTFSRAWTKVRNRFGGYTRVRVYWLEGQELQRARNIAKGRA